MNTAQKLDNTVHGVYREDMRLINIVCLPLEKNIAKPKHIDWKLVNCKDCDRACWESDIARYLMINEDHIGKCTECAMKGAEGIEKI